MSHLPEPEWLDTRAVAAMTSLTQRAIESLRQRGEGPAYSRIGRKIIRYRRADVEAWLERGKVKVQR